MGIKIFNLSPLHMTYDMVYNKNVLTKGENKMRDIRGSEISDFLKDRFTWKLRWIDHLVPNKPNNALFTGTLVHKFLEVYYQTMNEDSGYRAMQALFDETDTSKMEQFELDDLWDLVSNITHNYVEQWKETDSKIKVIATELTFRIPLDEEITYTGTIDLIYLDENGNLWLNDYKTTKSIEGYEKNALLDRQISRYIWAVQQLIAGNGEVLERYFDTTANKMKEIWVKIGIHILWSRLGYGLKPVHGFLYNLILKEVPQPPKVLKKGGLSKDKSQHTTWKLYWEALLDHGLLSGDTDALHAPAEYDEILTLLHDQETEFGNRYFKRVPVFRLQEEVDASIRDFHAAAKDLIQLEKEIQVGDESRVYMNITKDTAHSGYKHIIAATIAGENVEMIKQTLYRVEEEK